MGVGDGWVGGREGGRLIGLFCEHPRQQKNSDVAALGKIVKVFVDLAIYIRVGQEIGGRGGGGGEVNTIVVSINGVFCLI